MKQIGTAEQMYIQDYDERTFFRASATAPSPWRSDAIIPSANLRAQASWWNLLLPYINNDAVFTCPSDLGPTLSKELNLNLTIKRSYMALSTAESLALSQVEYPVDTMMITEKWDKDYTGVRTDSWIEPFNGDFSPDYQVPSRMFTAANRHTSYLNAAFLDGHARAFNMGQVLGSKLITGCELVYLYPSPGMGITNPSSAGLNQPNLCDPSTFPHFSYP